VPIRAAAVPRARVSATPTSSGAYSLATHPHRAVCGAPSAGRRRASSASSPACRAVAHEASRSNPTIASIRPASPSRAGSAVPLSSSNASHPDGAQVPYVGAGTPPTTHPGPHPGLYSGLHSGLDSGAPPPAGICSASASNRASAASSPSSSGTSASGRSGTGPARPETASATTESNTCSTLPRSNPAATASSPIVRPRRAANQAHGVIAGSRWIPRKAVAPPGVCEIRSARSAALLRPR
jgi:hypothetical protein